MGSPACLAQESDIRAKATFIIADLQPAVASKEAVGAAVHAVLCSAVFRSAALAVLWLQLGTSLACCTFHPFTGLLAVSICPNLPRSISARMPACSPSSLLIFTHLPACPA